MCYAFAVTGINFLIMSTIALQIVPQVPAVSVHSTHIEQAQNFDMTLWISFKQMQSSPLLLVYYSLCAYMRSFWLLKSREMCQHMTGSGRCPAIQTDINGFLFLLSLGPPTPANIFPSTLPSFVLPLFFLLSLPLSRHPGSHAPLRGLVWPFLPPFTHTYTHISRSPTTHWLDLARAGYEDKPLVSLA